MMFSHWKRTISRQESILTIRNPDGIYQLRVVGSCNHITCKYSITFIGYKRSSHTRINHSMDIAQFLKIIAESIFYSLRVMFFTILFIMIKNIQFITPKEELAEWFKAKRVVAYIPQIQSPITLLPIRHFMVMLFAQFLQ